MTKNKITIPIKSRSIIRFDSNSVQMPVALRPIWLRLFAPTMGVALGLS
jgi:hypothetical protein